MRRLILLALLLISPSVAVYGQSAVSGMSVQLPVHGKFAPSGACNGSVRYVDLATGLTYPCNQTTHLWEIDREVTFNMGAGGGAAAWGSIGGNILLQSDLQSALNGKALADLSNVNGTVDVNNFPAVQPVSIASMPSTPVTGIFWQATQPVSLVSVPTHPVTQSGTWNATINAPLPAGTNNIGDVDVLSLPPLPAGANTVGGVNLSQYTPVGGRLPVDGSAVIQPVNGTVNVGNTPNVNLSSALPTGANGIGFVRLGSATPFQCSLDNIGATLTQCQAAPGAGLRLYITDIVANSTTATAGQMLLRTGTSASCGTGTASILPAAATVARIPYPANNSPNGPTRISFMTPLQSPLIAALCVIGVATNTLSITITGFIGQ